MRIANAVSNENGTSKGGVAGDQTGKEIRLQNWYKRFGGWDTYLEPLDGMIAHRAGKIAKIIAENDSFGYDQVHRWSGLEAYPNGCGDFDCSSLAISCYILGGLDIPAKGYSGDIVKRLVATGKFRAWTDSEHTDSDALAVAGGIYVATGKHVVICVDDEAESGNDEIGIKTITAKGFVRVRTAPKTGKRIRTLRKGDTEPYEFIDEESGWYKLVDGYVTNNTRYIKEN